MPFQHLLYNAGKGEGDLPMIRAIFSFWAAVWFCFEQEFYRNSLRSRGLFGKEVGVCFVKPDLFTKHLPGDAEEA